MPTPRHFSSFKNEIKNNQEEIKDQMKLIMSELAKRDQQIESSEKPVVVQEVAEVTENNAILS